MHSLHRAGLIDEYRLITFTVTVGPGARTFPADAPPSGMELLQHQRTAAGAVYTTLRPTPFQPAAVVVVDGKDTVLA